MKRICLLLCAALILVVALRSAATAPGDVDLTFGGPGRVTTAFGSGDDSGQAVAVQGDGKILVAGSALNGSNYDIAGARYHAEGTLGTTFNSTGKVTAAVGSREVPIQWIAQSFPSVANQLTSSRAVEDAMESVAGQSVAGFRMSRTEKARIAPAALLPAEKAAWEAAARRADFSADSEAGQGSREFNVFFPGSYDGPFIATLGAQRVVMKAVGAKATRGVSREGRVEYAGAYDQVDSLHVPGAGQSEELLLLRSPAAPVVFNYEVLETEGVSEIDVRDGAVRFVPTAPEIASPFHSSGSDSPEVETYFVDVNQIRSDSTIRWGSARACSGTRGTHAQ